MQRTNGMESTKSRHVKVKTLRSPWTEQGAQEAVTSWLRLPTSRAHSIDLVGCQYDGIAMGARKAFEQHHDETERDEWLRLPFTGIDGLPDEGQAWVDRGLLTATVTAGITTRMAVELLSNALVKGTQTPERTVIEAQSYPSLERLEEIGQRWKRG